MLHLEHYKWRFGVRLQLRLQPRLVVVVVDYDDRRDNDDDYYDYFNLVCLACNLIVF